MKTLTLKKITLVNFKGIRSLEMEFDAGLTSICGRNGTGKTTLFDAFTWLLFGKDSSDRKVFDLKTLDDNGRAIPKLPHEVSAVLNVEGQDLTLTRRYTEKWTKRRGSAREEFTGHEEERIYDDVPCSAKEWAEKINRLCSESVFKMVTSPTYFTSQKSDVQRAMLLRMAGKITNADVCKASGRADFTTLLESLQGKTLEEYRREILAKKKSLNASLDMLPSRIDELHRNNAHYQDVDYQQCEADLKAKKAELAKVETQLEDITARFEASYLGRNEVSRKLSEAKGNIMMIRADISAQKDDEYYAVIDKQNDLQLRINSQQSLLLAKRQLLKDLEADIRAKTNQRDTLIAERKAINAMTLQFTEGDFICPTCGQFLEPDNAERKRMEMTANFQRAKSAKLQANTEKGQACSRAVLTKLDGDRIDLLHEVEGIEAEILNLQDQLANLPTAKRYTYDDIQPLLEADKRYPELMAEVERLTAEMGKTIDISADTEPLRETKSRLTAEIAELQATMTGRKHIEINNERIAEIEKQIKAQSDELARLENIEFVMADFSKARIEMVEQRINSLFSLVKFRMYSQQINGGEVETCEAMVKGVPYSSLNKAMRINAGLDIINAICKSEGIHAPIFVDNAEAVNDLLPMQSQVIRLVVSRDNELRKE